MELLGLVIVIGGVWLLWSVLKNRGRTPRTARAAARAYGPDWKKKSRRTRRRDQWTCAQCGWRATKRNRHFLHAHHIVPRSQGGDNALHNLTSLCVRCHAEQPGHGHLRTQSAYRRFKDVR